jgi:hypothetical protein
MLILAKLENDDKLTTIDEQTKGFVSGKFLLDVHEPNCRPIGTHDGHILKVESFLIMMTIDNVMAGCRDIECFRILYEDRIAFSTALAPDGNLVCSVFRVVVVLQRGCETL